MVIRVIKSSQGRGRKERREEENKGRKGGREGGRGGGEPTLVMSALVRRSSPFTGRMTGHTGFWVMGSTRVS